MMMGAVSERTKRWSEAEVYAPGNRRPLSVMKSIEPNVLS